MADARDEKVEQGAKLFLAEIGAFRAYMQAGEPDKITDQKCDRLIRWGNMNSKDTAAQNDRHNRIVRARKAADKK